MTSRLMFAVPSKGRLMEQTLDVLAKSGLEIRKTGNQRGYKGEIVGVPDVDVAFISASEIAWYLKSGRAHMGITGEDLIREQMSDSDERVEFIKKLGFGQADVVVAVPASWLDVRTMAHLDEIAASFEREHGRWFRVATKYMTLTRQFFASKGMSDYRIVESLGATEGTPGSGTADLIVDITSTGATLAANGLRILDDGVILRSEANLVVSKAAKWCDTTLAVKKHIVKAMSDPAP